MALRFPLTQIRSILDRFPRPGDPLEEKAREILLRLEPEKADLLWESICLRVLLNPVYLGSLWPDTCAQHPELRQLIQGIQEQLWVPALQSQVEDNGARWVMEQGDADEQGTLMAALLEYLQHFNAANDKSFAFLARYYTWRDIVVSQLVAPDRIALLDRLFGLLDMQVKQWGKPYCGGYAYQGYARIGLAGVKPTEIRLAGYGFMQWLKPQMHVLEIGCNNGFMAIELARHVSRVDALEYNPFLVEIGRLTAKELGQGNVCFEVADFSTWRSSTRYDVVLSFANHCTIDGNLAVDFECYVAKLWHLVDDGGLLLFESHNVFGPGSGAAGDDGDLDSKFDVMERYFELLDAKMTKTFVPSQDIDKLFVVLRRRVEILPQVSRRMSLAAMRQRYRFVGEPFAR